MTNFCWQRQLTSIIVMIGVSSAALGENVPSPARALLHASGKVEVNGSRSREITTLLSGDLIQTGEDSVANVTSDGSSVLVLPNALITYLGPGVELTRGGVSVTTTEETPVSSYGLVFTAAERRPSKFEVVEYEDLVIVAARQGNVIVTDGQQTSMVSEGQESTHSKRKVGATPAAEGSHWISAKNIAIIGGASGATVAGILLAQSNKKKKCVSASNSKKCKCKKDNRGNEDCEEDE